MWDPIPRICVRYDEAHIVYVDESEPEYAGVGEMIYISELSRTYETAHRLFGERAFCRTCLLNGVPLRSFRDTGKRYPLWVWNFVGRMQWLLENKRQPESRRETVLRAEKTVELAEDYGVDCYMITHGFYLRTLLRVLEKRRYEIRKPHKMGIGNLDMITAVSARGKGTRKL